MKVHDGSGGGRGSPEHAELITRGDVRGRRRRRDVRGGTRGLRGHGGLGVRCGGRWVGPLAHAAACVEAAVTADGKPESEGIRW